jgi:hypothetical protein
MEFHKANQTEIKKNSQNFFLMPVFMQYKASLFVASCSLSPVQFLTRHSTFNKFWSCGSLLRRGGWRSHGSGYSGGNLLRSFRSGSRRRAGAGRCSCPAKRKAKTKSIKDRRNHRAQIGQQRLKIQVRQKIQKRLDKLSIRSSNRSERYEDEQKHAARNDLHDEAAFGGERRMFWDCNNW